MAKNLEQAKTFDVGKLLGADWRAHCGIYSNPHNLQEELQRTWLRSWFYVAHESEIPHPGDFKSLTFAQQPLLVVRGEDDQVRVLFNICRHRAVTVCHEEEGNTKHFICAYHGWVYNTKGGLIGLSGPNCSVRRFTERRGLMPAPRLGGYRGFIFASLNPTGESLDAYLGEAKFFIDLVVDQSADGVEIITGRYRHSGEGAWRPVKGNDGENAQVANALVRAIPQGTQAPAFTNAPGLIKSLDNGHAILQSPTSSQCRLINHKRTELEQRVGKEKAQRICEVGQTLFIFPNLFLVDHVCTSLYILNPVAPDHMGITAMPFVPKGESLEIIAQRLRYYEMFLDAARNSDQSSCNATISCMQESTAKREPLS